MKDCYTRNSGGCIHLNPSRRNHQIRIEDSSFVNCFGMKYSFMDAEFSNEISAIPEVSIIKSKINYDKSDL